MKVAGICSLCVASRALHGRTFFMNFERLCACALVCLWQRPSALVRLTFSSIAFGTKRHACSLTTTCAQWHCHTKFCKAYAFLRCFCLRGRSSSSSSSSSCNWQLAQYLLSSAQLQAATDSHHTMELPRASREERLDSCKRAIHRLQMRVDRLRRAFNRESSTTLFRLNEIRSNLDRVLIRLDMEWADFLHFFA